MNPMILYSKKSANIINSINCDKNVKKLRIPSVTKVQLKYIFAFSKNYIRRQM